MNEFKLAVKAAATRDCKQCKCPLCSDIINLRINSFTGGIQAMCEGCGRYWIEGVEESAE